MSISTNYPFLIPGNYTFNSSEIEVSAGCRLLLQQGNIDFTEDFLTSTGLVLDSQKAEWLGNPDYLVRQKDQRPSNSIVGATYTSSLNANFAVDGFGSLNAVLNGTPVLDNGKLSCIGTGLYYSSTSIGNLSGDWVLKFKYTPKYSGAAPVNYNLLALYPEIGPTNRVVLFDNPAGLRLTANGISAVNLGTWSPVADTEYVFEMVCISNNLSIFINDSQQGGTQVITPGQGTDAIRLWIGACSDLYNASNGLFNDVILYSTATQTPTYTLPEYSFYETTVVLPEMEHIGDGTIKLFNSFATVESGAPRYVLQIGRSGNYLYWTGTAWAVSDGSYAQANDKTTFNANCGTLPVDGEKYGQFAIIFQDSNTISSVSQVTANMNVDIGYLITNPSILINGTFRHEDLEGFFETATKTGSDELKYILKKGSNFYWWTGSAWAVSDETYAQANTAAEIYTNRDTFTTEIVVSQVKVFLHSADGSSTPEITNLEIQYNFAGETPDTINTCIVWGYCANTSGVDTQIIKIRLNKKVAKYKDNIIFRSQEITVTPYANGYWEAELAETENMETGTRWIFDFGDREEYEGNIPDQETASFWDVV